MLMLLGLAMVTLAIAGVLWHRLRTTDDRRPRPDVGGDDAGMFAMFGSSSDSREDSDEAGSDGADAGSASGGDAGGDGGGGDGGGGGGD